MHRSASTSWYPEMLDIYDNSLLCSNLSEEQSLPALPVAPRLACSAVLHKCKLTATDWFRAACVMIRSRLPDPPTSHLLPPELCSSASQRPVLVLCRYGQSLNTPGDSSAKDHSLFRCLAVAS